MRLSDILFQYSPASRQVETWRWIWPLLAVGFACRLIVWHYFPYMAHPDEVFQYYEQAYRVVYGYGIIPWEYVYGIRSWLIPFSLAGILEIGRFIGFDTPDLYIPFVAILLSALSLVLPLGMYRLAQHILDEEGAIIAFFFGLFWWHFLYFAHKPMPGILATYALVWCFVFLFRQASLKNLLICGLLAGLVLVLRYQLAPVFGILGLFAIIRLGWSVWPAFLSSITVIVLAGLLDMWTWDVFLFSFVENFRLNFAYDISSVFGMYSWGFYIEELTRQTAGLGILALFGTILVLKTSWPIVVAVIAGVAALHIPAHKEFRFIVWALPVLFIALAAVVCYISNKWRYSALLKRVCFLSFALAGVVVTAFAVNPLDTWKRDHLALRSAFLAISGDERVTGLELRTLHGVWWRTYGYYALGRPVPVYFFDHGAPSGTPGWSTSGTPGWGDRSNYVSHIVTEEGNEPPLGFELISEDGGLQTWRSTKPTKQADVSTLQLLAPLPKNDQLLALQPKPPAFLLAPSIRDREGPRL